MDTLFDISTWHPTKPPSPSDEPLTADDIATLSRELRDQTRAIYRSPYNPSCLFVRSLTLERLRYPELALADAWKGNLLCQSLLQRLYDERWNWRLGSDMGFWMREEGNDEDEDEELQRKVALIEKLTHDTKVFKRMSEKGKFVRRPYPWMNARHRRRDGALLRKINEEIRSNSVTVRGGHQLCKVRRHAFGENGDSSNILGVFARHNIRRGEAILVDTTSIWGCNGPGVHGDTNNLNGGRACDDPLHPNIPSDSTARDLRWIRDELGSDAHDTIVLCRLLLEILQTPEIHPLDHPLAARLTPHFPLHARTSTYTLQDDIAIPLRALQGFGMDIFAPSNAQHFESWILFTLAARVSNNRCSTPIATAVFPLFSLFNHSCAPNVRWGFIDQTSSTGHGMLKLSAVRSIRRGEQMFVCYDGYAAELGLKKRRRELRTWMHCCRCERCEREEREEEVVNGIGCQRMKQKKRGGQEWDVDSKGVLPEDRV